MKLEWLSVAALGLGVLWASVAGVSSALDRPHRGAGLPPGQRVARRAVRPPVAADAAGQPGRRYRVYVGAHNPLDVTAGLGAGLLLGGVVAAFVD
jgi:hypothetical protein